MSVSKQLWFFIFIFILGYSQIQALGQVPKWFTNIKLFESTRNDVEKLLVNYEIESVQWFKSGLTVEYRKGETLISVAYSNGSCQDGSVTGYDVPKDKVIELYSNLAESSIKLNQFGFDLSKFDKSAVEDVIGMYIYENETDGIKFVWSNSRVTSITLSPSLEQEKLACENIKNPL